MLRYFHVAPNLQEIFAGIYRDLRPGTPVPEFKIAFFPFANVNSTIRLRQGKLLVRLSDLLEGAPEGVLRAIAHILLAKLYRQPSDPAWNAKYRRYVSSHDLAQKAHLVRQIRGRKHVASARGHVHDLEALFEELNHKYFHGLMGRPRITWSRGHARNSLAHYDPAHNTIVVSKVFDDPRLPRYVVEYILFHEMLHLKHPVKLRGSRRCVHSSEFVREEKQFPHYVDAQKWLKKL